MAGQQALRGKQKELLSLITELSIHRNAGLSLAKSLKNTGDHITKSSLQKAIYATAMDIENGSTFSIAAARHPNFFNKLFISIVEAGEKYKKLDFILVYLEDYLEKLQLSRESVSKPLKYMAAVVIIAATIISIILIAVIPQFKKLFADMGVALPAMTEMLIGISDCLVASWGILFLWVSKITFVHQSLRANKTFNTIFCKLQLKIPVVESIVRFSSFSFFFRTFGMLICSGIPISYALVAAKNSIPNHIIANAISIDIEKKGGLGNLLEDCGCFDNTVVNMIRGAEQNGKLVKTINNIAEDYEQKVKTLTSSTQSLMEPGFIIFLGLIIGFIVIALFLPLVCSCQHMG